MNIVGACRFKKLLDGCGQACYYQHNIKEALRCLAHFLAPTPWIGHQSITEHHFIQQGFNNGAL